MRAEAKFMMFNQRSHAAFVWRFTRAVLLNYIQGKNNAPGRFGEYQTMPKVTIEIPDELMNDLDEHVGDDKKFVNRSDAVRASIRKTLDMLDDIDARHGRIDEE